MFLEILKSKIHKATLTDVQLDYEGSIEIDEQIYEAANMSAYEKVLVVNLNNGQRFETYIIKGQRGSKKVCVNGAAARLAHKGDQVIIMCFAYISAEEKDSIKPTIIKLDHNNNII